MEKEPTIRINLNEKSLEEHRSDIQNSVRRAWSSICVARAELNHLLLIEPNPYPKDVRDELGKIEEILIDLQSRTGKLGDLLWKEG